MELLIALKSIRSGNELLKAGDKFLIEDGQGLIERGYARRLTQDETRAILEEYVHYAEEIFSEPANNNTVSADKEHKIFYQESLFTRVQGAI